MISKPFFDSLLLTYTPRRSSFWQTVHPKSFTMINLHYYDGDCAQILIPLKPNNINHIKFIIFQRNKSLNRAKKKNSDDDALKCSRKGKISSFSFCFLSLVFCGTTATKKKIVTRWKGVCLWAYKFFLRFHNVNMRY